MRAWWSTERDVLELREVAVPTPGVGQLLVKVCAASLNRGEFVGHRARGDRPMGVEISGMVTSSGGGTGLTRGTRIAARTRGGFAEYAIVEEKEAIPIPPVLGWTEAAAIPLAYIVAYESVIKRAGLRVGESLLVVGATSNLGEAAAQLGDFFGAEVLLVARSAERLAALGLPGKVAGTTEGFRDALSSRSRWKGADVVLDVVGSTLHDSIAVLGGGGRLVVAGFLGGKPSDPVDFVEIHRRRLSILGTSNAERTAEDRVSIMPDFIGEVMPAFADSRIVPRISSVFQFEELPRARDAMLAQHRAGKVILAIGSAEIELQ